MEILPKVAGISTNFIIISLLTTISIVLGCGVMPAVQGSTRNFTVSGFTFLSLWLTPAPLTFWPESLILQLARQELKDLWNALQSKQQPSS
ncbi:hypothetical protein KIN20_012483 [Parelaphostrongylus tenuis]|uniref:Uncharacterized protein n=1 Tax=Parelaphostrongylus tenuis TaxID=148309 RepID=A0AAD5MWY6_PARTN|nr:hypothetical protein KIN20_012483 [Parelaphostrongylus tenuis]